MADLGTSLLQWLNKNSLSSLCTQISELSDGVLLYELLNNLSPDYFDMECISIDVKNNWALKLGNLRRLKKALDKYLEEELKISNSRFDRIDLPNLARKASQEDIIKLFECIFFALVNCPKKHVYIQKIMELEESSQVQLMFFIQKIIGEDQDNPIQDTDLFKKELDMLKSEKKKLSARVLELEQELSVTTEERNMFSVQMHQFKAENERLYADMERKSVQEERHSITMINELRIRLNEKDEVMNELRRSTERLKKGYENEISQLKDDLDIATAKIYQNINADKNLQQLKKRLESLSGIKQKAMDLQKQNENLMETVSSQHSEIEALIMVKKQVVMLKEQITKEKNRADTLGFNLENKEKTIKRIEKENIEYKQRVALLESKNMELMERQDSNSEDSFLISNDIGSPLNLLPRVSVFPASREQLDSVTKELEALKSALISKKAKIKTFKERILMCLEESSTRSYELIGIIKQVENNNSILSEQIQVMNENLSEKENDKIVHEQTMYELEEVKAVKAGLLSDIKAVYLEKDAADKKFSDCREELSLLQSQFSSKILETRELELELRVMKEKIRAFDDKERLYKQELASFQQNPSKLSDTSENSELERTIIALKNENTELQYRLTEKTSRITELIASKAEVIKEMEQKNQENEAKYKSELEIKTQELMAQTEEATKELFKKTEQLAAKLQYERRNTMIGWQRAMSIKDPTLLVTDEIYRLREALLDKEKEIERVNRNNKELKSCWKDSAKLLKAVWRQLGDETKKIEEAVKKRHS